MAPQKIDWIGEFVRQKRSRPSSLSRTQGADQIDELDGLARLEPFNRALRDATGLGELRLGDVALQSIGRHPAAEFGQNRLIRRLSRRRPCDQQRRRATEREVDPGLRVSAPSVARNQGSSSSAAASP